jgi:hypothetical protein
MSKPEVHGNVVDPRGLIESGSTHLLDFVVNQLRTRLSSSLRSKSSMLIRLRRDVQGRPDRAFPNPR